MKRLFALLLALSMVLCLSACDGGKKGAAAASTGSDLTWEEIEKLAEKAAG